VMLARLVALQVSEGNSQDGSADTETEKNE
jgi:hypothetical protein